MKTISWKKNLFFVWLSQILSLAGFAAVMPFLPIYFRDHFGMLDEESRGLWVSAFNFLGMLSFCLLAPVWGVLSDKYGRKLMLLRANYVTALLMPFLALAPNIWIMILIRLMVSAFSGTVTAAQTLIAATTPEKHQGFALGMLSTALWSGNMLGFVAGGILVTTLGFAWAFAICGVMYLVGGVLIHLFVDEDFDRKAVKAALRAAPRRRFNWQQAAAGGVGVVLSLFVLMGVARRFDEAYIAMMVEKVHGLADTAYYTGWISALSAVGGIVSGMAIGKLCDRYPPITVALPSLVVCVVGMLAQAFAFNLTMLGVARFITFLAAGGLEPAFQTLLSRLSPPEKRGILFGWASSLRMGGILLSSLLAGGVIYFLGTRWVFIFGAGAFILLIPILLRAKKHIVQPQKG